MPGRVDLSVKPGNDGLRSPTGGLGESHSSPGNSRTHSLMRNAIPLGESTGALVTEDFPFAKEAFCLLDTAPQLQDRVAQFKARLLDGVDKLRLSEEKD